MLELHLLLYSCKLKEQQFETDGIVATIPSLLPKVYNVGWWQANDRMHELLYIYRHTSLIFNHSCHIARTQLLLYCMTVYVLLPKFLVQ